jgi:hopanoid biosynthesis associated membrane protein HpnM
MNLLARTASVLLLLACAFPIQADDIQERTPSQVIEHLHETLLSIMKEAEALRYAGRHERLAPVLSVSYDLPFLASFTIGRYWKDLDQTQQKTFIEAFRELTIATYASRFDGYSGERFVTLNEIDESRGRKLVRSKLVKANGEEIRFDYLLHRMNGHWQIINVVVDGVSDLALKRAEYGGLMKRNGFSALLGQIKEQIARYADTKA